jgi:predicted  nucleic acid-binding Zn-ribbon protein
VSNLSQQVAELEGQLDRANRERTSLTNQLEDTLRKLTNQEQESTTVLNGFLKEEITILNYVWFE